MRTILHPRMIPDLEIFFDKICTVQQDSGTGSDEYGELTESWAAVPGLEDVPCAIGDVSADDRASTNATPSVVDMLKVMLKGYYPEVTGDMRIVTGGLVYQVLSVAAPQERAHTRLIVGRLT